MIKKISFFIAILFLIGCGFTPIYKENINNKFNLMIVKTSGEKDINRYILSNLKNYSDDKIQKQIKIDINTNYTKKAISKDGSGNTSAYKLIVTTEFNVDNGIEQKKIFITEKLNQNNTDNLFEQKKYEDNIKKNIASLIVNNFISQLIVDNDN
jgi:outer membrane lipopolysaccharide assembly protein LptE/RlpB